MPDGTRAAELLLDIGAVRLNVDPPFTWTSGIKAPLYCDNRMIYSHPDARDVIVDALVSRIRTLQVEPDCIAGTATAAIGWAALVADRLRLPFVYVRKEKKAHGAQKRIEGDLKPQSHVAIVEDLLSTGGSAVSTAQALREEGEALVSDVAAIFSYELDRCREQAQENSLQLHPVTDLSTLLNVAQEQGRIEEEEVKTIGAFTSDPEGWAAKQ